MFVKLSRNFGHLLLSAIACLAWTLAAVAQEPKAPDSKSTKANAKEAEKPRFVDRGEYVEDTKTGLLWQKDGTASGKLNFYDATKYAKSLKLADLTGWRLPTPKELAKIFPATDKPFTNTKYNKEMCCAAGEFNSYWTSQVDPRLEDYAYVYQWYARGGPTNCCARKN